MVSAGSGDNSASDPLDNINKNGYNNTRYNANNDDNEEPSSSPYNLLRDDDDDVNDNATARWVIHAVLVAFCVVVGLAVLLTFVRIRKYGLVEFVCLFILLALLVGLVLVIDSVMKETVRYQPIRRE